MVGLVIGLYCDNNANDFVEVAKDLLKEEDSIITESRSDLGLSVHKKMVDKKIFIKSKYGPTFTYPQRFQYC
jgi:hypothetical protein